jgi:1,4-alpha-glucan branching enzyme
MPKERETISHLKAINHDPYLAPFAEVLRSRLHAFRGILRDIEAHEKDVQSFASDAVEYGLRKTDYCWTFREYLPDAQGVSLIGDFNGWDLNETKLQPEPFGRWAVTLPTNFIKHGQKYRIAVWTKSGSVIQRVPAWAVYVVQNEQTKLFDAVVWDPPGGTYVPKHVRPPKPEALTIYEAHVGMSSSEPKVATYREFKDFVLPRIKRLGYNTLQLMAIMEHAYYGSFGYHVTSFFAPSSRFGTPDDLRELIDTAHGMGITVLMDIVHSHMSNNHLDGIAALDGSDHCYTHAGPSGRHELWDSALFDYSKWEVRRFLLSNCRYYIEDIGFDGFRFDGVTSMLYKHHGIGVGFSGDYNEYFGENSAVDSDAVVYLMLANHYIHQLIPNAITIAEDVSGMPLLCRPVEEGGVGFDYRLAMAIPDMWIKLLKETRDEDWNVGHIVHTLTNRRWNEKTVAYAESHDQAIVGDKTISMWLLDSAIYTDMNLASQSLVVDRGIALHKMIRLLSMSLGNSAYLNFIGNEFGHPEWVDFPREGNGWSYHWCRRRWDLPDCGYLRYTHLENFDAAMLSLDRKYAFLESTDEYVLVKDEGLKAIAFERGQLLFIFNFHPSNSLVNFPVPTRIKRPMKVVFDSDQREFGGHGDRISHATLMIPHDNHVKVYIPPRCCAVLRPESH